MSFSQAKLLAAEAVRLDQQHNFKDAMSFYADAARELLNFVRNESDPQKRKAFKAHAVRYLERAEALKRNERRQELIAIRKAEDAIHTGHWADELLGERLTLKDSTTLAPSKYIANARLLLLLFAAQWSPQCRSLVLKFAKLFEDTEKKFPNLLKVVFISADRSAAACQAFSAQQPWALLPFGDRHRKGVLTGRYQVTSVPCLVLMDGATGKLLSPNAAEGMQSRGSDDTVAVWVSMSSNPSMPAPPVEDSAAEDEQPLETRTREMIMAAAAAKEPMDFLAVKTKLVAEFGVQAMEEQKSIVQSLLKAYAETGDVSAPAAAAAATAPAPAKAPRRRSPPVKWANLVFGAQLIAADGRREAPASLLAGSHVVCVYFGGGWNPKCRELSERLGAFAVHVQADVMVRTVCVFVSHDKDAAAFAKSKASLLNWSAVPFDDRFRKGRLDGFFKVSGVPRVVVLNGLNGEVLKTHGLPEITPTAVSTSAASRAVIKRWMESV